MSRTDKTIKLLQLPYKQNMPELRLLDSLIDESVTKEGTVHGQTNTRNTTKESIMQSHLSGDA